MSHMCTGANFLSKTSHEFKLATAISKNFESIICEICDGFAYSIGINTEVIVLKASHLGIYVVPFSVLIHFSPMSHFCTP